MKSLEQLKIIEVTRSPLYVDEDGPRNSPNKYKLNFDVELINDERNKVTKITVNNPSDYEKVLTRATIDLFPNREWADMDKILDSLLIEGSSGEAISL
ncbi:hypothetical protein RZN25_05865 [Bacillaceae bacterium S4-13-56]